MGVDARGRPLRYVLTGGEHNDRTRAIALIEGLKSSYVLADKGYDTDKIIETIERMKAISVIPPKKIAHVKGDMTRKSTKNGSWPKEASPNSNNFAGGLHAMTGNHTISLHSYILHH